MAGSPTRLRSAEIRLVSIMSTSQVSKQFMNWNYTYGILLVTLTRPSRVRSYAPPCLA